MVRKVGMGRQAGTARTASWEDYFDSGEKLLWQGAPATGIRYSIQGLIISIFGIFFLTFSILWVGVTLLMTIHNPGAYLFPLLGLPFVLAGLWLVAGHWFYDAYKRKHTRYALTNQRALIARTVFGRKMESYPVNKHSNITMVSGGLDTVNFSERQYRNKDGDRTVPIGFRFINDGQKVYDLLRDVRKQNGSRDDDK